ncbi:MAG: hypothetical protein ABSA67_11270 [Candidatus Brocadiia bacterium]|jgi:hypothetical protein
MAGSIRDLHLDVDSAGKVCELRVAFGPHYSLHLQVERGKPKFTVRASHHGVELDASEINGQLEKAIDKLRAAYPASQVD